MEIGQRVKGQALQKLAELNLNKASSHESINQALSTARLSAHQGDIYQSLALSNTNEQAKTQNSGTFKVGKDTLSTRLLKSKTEEFKTQEIEKQKNELKYTQQKSTTFEEQQLSIQKLAPKKQKQEEQDKENMEKYVYEKFTYNIPEKYQNTTSRYMQEYENARQKSKIERNNFEQTKEREKIQSEAESKKRAEDWKTRSAQLKRLEEEILKKDQEDNKKTQNQKLSAYRRARMQLDGIEMPPKEKVKKQELQEAPDENNEKDSKPHKIFNIKEFERSQQNAEYNKQMKLDNLKNQLRNKEMQNCTYKPQINTNYKFKGQQKIFMDMKADDRLYLQAKLKNEVQKAWEQIQVTAARHFSPKITKAPAYIEQMAKDYKEEKENRQVEQSSSSAESPELKPNKMLTEDQYMEITNRLYQDALDKQDMKNRLVRVEDDRAKQLANTRHIAQNSLILAQRREQRKWDEIYNQMIECQQQNQSLHGSAADTLDTSGTNRDKNVLVARTVINFIENMNFNAQTTKLIIEVLEKYKTLTREEFFLEVTNAEKKANGYII